MSILVVFYEVLNFPTDFSVFSINFQIKEGTIVGIVGQVGSGKSTLLSAILGETEKLSGDVTVKVIL